jgi:hypothetical protein
MTGDCAEENFSAEAHRRRAFYAKYRPRRMGYSDRSWLSPHYLEAESVKTDSTVTVIPLLPAQHANVSTGGKC